MMKILGAIVLYIIILVLVLQNQLVVAGVAVLFFSIKYGTMALIPAGVLIDGYFGNFYTIPYMSIVATLWHGLVEYIRPIVLIRYHSRYE